MTREEIIEQLDAIVGTYEILIGNGVNSDILDVDDIEAIKEAISALSENKGDLITRQTVINAIANTCFWLSGDDWNELIECINSIPSVENKGEWIPVSERLPEESTWVLVTCKNPDGYIFLDIKLINRYSKMWDGDEDFIGTVLAWQPLPEPYKGGE